MEIYGHFHFHFDSFFNSCAHATIAHHQRSFLIITMCISYYQQHVSIALQHVQAIVIFQHDMVLGKHSSSLSHIIANALSLLANLW